MGSLQPYFNLYQFPTGRCLFALQGVLGRARSRNLEAIAALCEGGIAEARRAVLLEAQWRRARGVQVGRRQRAVELDTEVDRLVGAIATQLGAVQRGFGATGLGAQATELLELVLPEGAVAITSMSYENELAACEVLLDDLTGKHAERVVSLGLSPFVERLRSLTGEFRQALEDEVVREVTFDAVRQAQAEGQEALLRVVAKILGDHGGPSEEEVALRQTLLGPILAQNRRLKERYASRRGSNDVNPETGEELSDAETVGAAPAGPSAAES